MGRAEEMNILYRLEDTMYSRQCASTRRGAVPLLFAFLLVTAGGLVTPAAAQSTRLYVPVDKSQVVTFAQDPITKISVTNPAIADVFVMSPTQLMVSGKAVGATSLVVFYASSVQYIDLIVHPSPVVTSHAPLTSEAHTVLIQKADKVTNHLFVRDAEKVWVDLGSLKTEPDAAKK